MHVGMTHFVNCPRELWESCSWGSSIWSTSDEFAYYSDGQPIFLSDIILFHLSALHSTTSYPDIQLGRVIMIGKDFSSQASVSGTVIHQVQKVLRSSDILGSEIRLLCKDLASLPLELFLCEDGFYYFTEEDILWREEDVYLDLSFWEWKQECGN